MTKSRLAVALVALVALALPAAASAATDPLDAVQWHMVKPKPGTPFNTFNEINNSPFGPGDRTFGADLEWGRRGDWIVSRKPVGNVRDHRGYVDPTEQVALYNTKARRYLNYSSQRFGINLDWEKTASYEWKLAFDYKRFASSLYNVTAGDYLVYGKRSYGINLQWLADRRKAQQQQDANGVGTVHDASVSMTAQPPVSGYVPFLGRYGGGGSKSVLTKVANPANGAALSFVKPGHSSNECGNSDAVIRLAPGQSLTADQMKTIWNAAQPSLAQTLPFLACAATQASTVWVNVQYRVTG
jgi:hypothetical protein